MMMKNLSWILLAVAVAGIVAVIAWLAWKKKWFKDSYSMKKRGEASYTVKDREQTNEQVEAEFQRAIDEGSSGPVWSEAKNRNQLEVSANAYGKLQFKLKNKKTGKRYKCKDNRPFVLKKKKNNACPPKFKDSGNNEYKRQCYRCMNKKEKKKYDKESKKQDDYFKNIEINNPGWFENPDWW